MTDLNKEREAFAQTEFNTFGLNVKDFKTTGEYFMFIGWLMRLELEKAKAQAVAEGYVLVPKEPTEKMLKRGNRLALSDSQYRYDAASIYEVMLEASESGDEG